MQESVDLNNLTEREKEAAIRGVESYRAHKRRVEESQRVMKRVKIAKQMKEQGFTITQIAESLGVSYQMARTYSYESEYRTKRRQRYLAVHDGFNLI